MNKMLIENLKSVLRSIENASGSFSSFWTSNDLRQAGSLLSDTIDEIEKEALVKEKGISHE